MLLKHIKVSEQRSPVVAVSITILWCFQIHTVEDYFTYKGVTTLSHVTAKRCFKGVFKPIFLWPAAISKIHANFVEVVYDFSSQLLPENKIYKRHHACQIKGSWLELKEL